MGSSSAVESGEEWREGSEESGCTVETLSGGVGAQVVSNKVQQLTAGLKKREERSIHDGCISVWQWVW